MLVLPVKADRFGSKRGVDAVSTQKGTGPLSDRAVQSRRQFLARSAGAGLFLLGVDRFPHALRGLGQGTPSDVATSNFFLYGLSAGDPSVPASFSGGDRNLGIAPLLGGIATLPELSPDGETIALISIGGQTWPSVTVHCLDAESGTQRGTGTLLLPEVPLEATVLVAPTFAADSKTLCLVLSVTEPVASRTLPKMDPDSGSVALVESATWVSRHLLTYYDVARQTFQGPFDLADGPSLARINLTANADALFVWSMDYPVPLTTDSLEKSTALPPPIVPRLAAYPLGSAVPRFVVDAPGPWPVNGEPTGTLLSGDLVRLVNGTTIEVSAATNGAAVSVTVPELDRIGAHPSAPTMEVLASGQLFVSAPAIGTAVLIDPADSLATSCSLDYPLPRYGRGGPTSKAILTDDRQTLYVLGDGKAGGVTRYDFHTGRRVGSFSDGAHFSAIRQLGNGNILAVQPDGPALYLLSPDLELIEIGACDLHVAAVF